MADTNTIDLLNEDEENTVGHCTCSGAIYTPNNTPTHLLYSLNTVHTPLPVSISMSTYLSAPLKIYYVI